jgi:hypothetical protein
MQPQTEIKMTDRHKRLLGILATSCLACIMAAAPGARGAAPEGQPLPDLCGATAAPTAPSDGPSAADLERIAR